MKLTNTVSATPKIAITGLMTLALVFSIGACNDDTLLTGVDTNRIYTQIERLGNPLVSEVFFPKRDHGLHNNKSPSDDTKTTTSTHRIERIRLLSVGADERFDEHGRLERDEILLLLTNANSLDRHIELFLNRERDATFRGPVELRENEARHRDRFLERLRLRDPVLTGRRIEHK